jgi:gas vesicle protein
VGKNGKYFVAGAIVGGLIGAAVALLTAPKTGRELREELSKNLEAAMEKGMDLYFTVKSQAEGMREKVNDLGTELSGRWLELPVERQDRE